jgi:murein DD-endopeptidase MepM/ murein hydrolase activator NlpD
VAITAIVLASVPALAAATTGGAPTAAGRAAPAASPSGKPDPAPSAGAVRLISAVTSPRKSFYYGFRSPRLSYEIASDQPENDLRVDVVNGAGETVKSFFRNDVPPGTIDSVRWDGSLARDRPAPNGRYVFRLVPQQGGPALRLPFARSSSRDRSSAPERGGLSFAMYGYAFPLLGGHDFGSSGARFGAARSGHTHQGQDIMAGCGLPIVAARGGRVRYAGWDGAAGNYVVIDGRGTGFDTVYMHLRRPSPLHTGDPVRTSQPIGVVGETGDASGCHLHFELWTAPGWYEGGSPLDPLPYLKKWDSYS